MQSTAEQFVQQLVRQVDQGEKDVNCLVEFLKEQANIYQQQTRAAVIRMRGWILYAFSRHNIPERAIPFVFEELESGIDPYTVAAAAKAVTKVYSRDYTVASLLLKAQKNIKNRNDTVSFAHYGAYSTDQNDSTAGDEINKSLEYFGIDQLQINLSESVLKKPDSPCCASLKPSSTITSKTKSSDILKCELEDHHGRVISYEGFFRHYPTILVFFYTRCDNPNKCHDTMTKLAQIQKDNRIGQIQTAAITYDPGYDDPERLNAYASTFSLCVSDQHRLFRTIDCFDQFRGYFDLGVGCSGSIVNRHQIEAFVVDKYGRPFYAAKRLQWSVGELIVKALKLMH